MASDFSDTAPNPIPVAARVRGKRVLVTVHAARSKQARAEPVAALYEQGRVHHVGLHAELEEQLCSWVPGEGESPDRLDALVWAVTSLVVTPQQGG